MNREPHLVHVRFDNGRRSVFAAPSAAVADTEARAYLRNPGVVEATTDRGGAVQS